VSEGYSSDDTEKAKIRQACEIVKERVRDQALSVKPEDFMISVRGRKALRESLNAMFKEERDSPSSWRKVRL
jgi:hypothetical protein